MTDQDVLAPLDGSGEEWWARLTPAKRQHLMWPRFEAGHTPTQILTEFGLPKERIGIVSGQRNQWRASKGQGPPSHHLREERRQKQGQSTTRHSARGSVTSQSTELDDDEQELYERIMAIRRATGLHLRR